ncbi:MAG TPA: phosphate acyltransferase PlsX [Anaerolineales bacterium]|nr:phosphate acyltransferase PlsX [Anaerolineales bacterium]
MRIVLDGMGSDKYPTPEAEGALMAAQALNCEIIVTGDEPRLKAALEQASSKGLPSNIRIVHAPQVISMGEKPAFAARSKSDNSMARGIQLVRDGEADAFVTMGNTGAALTNGLLILRRIRGCKRPALTAPIPTATGKAVLLDVGANSECKPEFLLQFAIMGSLYAERVLGIANPRVGLLNNGEEAGKGNELAKATYPLLKTSGLNFVGNIEGKEAFNGSADVIVTDGFTGNIALKVAEAVAKLVGQKMKDALKQNPLAMVGGLLAQSALRNAVKDLDPREIGAAPLLGLNGLVMVGHGRSDGQAVFSAIKSTQVALEQNMLSAIRETLAQKLTEEDETES